MNPFMSYLEEAGHPEGKALAKKIRELQAMKPRPKDWELKVFELSEKLYVDTRKRLMLLNEKAEQAKKRYEKRKDAATRLLDRARWSDKYSVMDESQIDDEAAAYENAKGEDLKAWAPDRLEVLRKNVKGPIIREALDKVLKRNRYEEQWRLDEPELSAEVDLYSAPFGTVRFDLGEGKDQLGFEGIQEADIAWLAKGEDD